MNPDADINPNRKSSELPPFYVVTVSYDSHVHLERMVQSLLPLENIKSLIVVDHSPHRNAIDLSAPFPIEVFAQENKGYGAGVKAGLRQVKGDDDAVVLICNPDVELLSPEVIPKAVRFMKHHPEVAFLAPQLVNGELHPIASCRYFYTFSSLITSAIPYSRNRPGQYRAHHFHMDLPLADFDVDWASGSAFLTRLSLFQSILKFDERYFLYFGDVDLCMQIHQLGLSVVYYPDLVFKHHEQRRSRSSTPENAFCQSNKIYHEIARSS